MSRGLVVFDCDSTLSAIEGVDELARLRGPEVFASVEQATNDAMNGKVRVDEVFGRRLELIRPDRAAVEAVGRQYLETMEPSAPACVEALRKAGWDLAIVSGGFRQAIRPLADLLGIARVEAVDLFFNPDGSYAGFDEAYPTTRNGGKPEVLKVLREETQAPVIVMVGDGASDLETKGMADKMIGFGRYVRREKVVAGADAFICDLAELPALLKS